MIVVKLVCKIRFHLEELADIEQELDGLLKQLNIRLETVPGISTVTAAEFVAEIGNIHRFATADKLAQFAGIAPVKDGSGNKMRIRKNKLGNRTLHELFKDLAARQIQVAKKSKKQRNPHMYAYYEQKLAAGKTKQQALVCIMRKLVNIVYSLMKNGKEYEMPALPPKAVS